MVLHSECSENFNISISVNFDWIAGKITIEVCDYDKTKEKYTEWEFPADEFATAINKYEDMIERYSCVNHTISSLWEYACSGNNGRLASYYRRRGKLNNRHCIGGRYNSLIAGAYRNGHYDTVKYLISVGETILPSEKEEIDYGKVYDKDLYQSAENLVDYFSGNHENLTKEQCEKIKKLRDVLRLINR